MPCNCTHTITHSSAAVHNKCWQLSHWRLYCGLGKVQISSISYAHWKFSDRQWISNQRHWPAKTGEQTTVKQCALSVTSVDYQARLPVSIWHVMACWSYLCRRHCLQQHGTDNDWTDANCNVSHVNTLHPSSWNYLQRHYKCWFMALSHINYEILAVVYQLATNRCGMIQTQL